MMFDHAARRPDSSMGTDAFDASLWVGAGIRRKSGPFVAFRQPGAYTAL
jgi:hypothetical protein